MKCFVAIARNDTSPSLSHVLHWAYWWNSTEAWLDDVTKDQVVIELNTDFSTKGLSAQEVTAIVAAWQSGALSRDSMLDLFRRGEVLPEGRTNEEETALVKAAGRKVVADGRGLRGERAIKKSIRHWLAKGLCIVTPCLQPHSQKRRVCHSGIGAGGFRAIV